MGADVMKTDVSIVGGGPAGLAAGIAIRQRGLQVTLADPAKPPIDKACGEGLMPQAVEALLKLGVRFGAGQAIPFRGIRFISEAGEAQGEFCQRIGLGVRRTTLHQTLAERAAEAGVQCLWAECVKRISPGEIWLGSRRIECRWIIGADGQNSLVRKWAGLESGRAPQARFGFRRHFCVAPWTNFVEVYWGNHCQIVVTPVGREEVCLAVTSRCSQMRIEESVSQFPALARRLGDRLPLGQERGAISALRVLRRVCRGPVALVGDASGSVDSLTGEGLGLAFRQATAVADALLRGDLGRYQAAHRRINRQHEILSRVLLLMENRAWLRRRAIETFSKEPQLFERLLAAHATAFSPRSFGLGNIFKLSWRLLATAG